MDYYEQLREVLGKGDEQQARDFLTKNFKEFPEDIQDAIVSAFLVESLDQSATTLKNQSTLASEATESMNWLVQLKHSLDKLEQLEQIKKSA